MELKLFFKSNILKKNIKKILSIANPIEICELFLFSIRNFAILPTKYEIKLKSYHEILKMPQYRALNRSFQVFLWTLLFLIFFPTLFWCF